MKSSFSFARTFAAAVLALGLSVFGIAAQAEMVLRVGNMGEPKSMDPHFVSGTWEDRITGDMFMGLTTDGSAGETIPGMAESWVVSDDGLMYTFKLGNHVWSDGEPVTAEDFVYSMRRILLPETAAEYASLLYTIKNAEGVNSGEMAPDQLAVRALDDKTLEITLKSPTPFFIDQLTHYTAYPVPRHTIEKFGNDWVKAENIVSNGPYMLKEWVPNTHIILEKNPRFYDAANIKIDQVIYDPSEDRTTVQKSFRAGELDLVWDFASEQIDWLRENLADETRIVPMLGTYYYPINSSKPPFNDKRIRQALSMSVNREVLTEKVLKTGEVPAYSFVPPGAGNYSAGPSYVSWKDLSQAEKDAKAKALLADAGYGPDNPLKFTLSYNTSENHKRVAVAVAAMWKKLGVEVELFNSEVKVHYDNLKQAQFDVARAGWIADYNDPQNFLYLLEKRTGVNNYGRYDNPEYDQLMIEAESIMDKDKRAMTLAKAESLAMEDQPIIPIYYYVSKRLVSPKVNGWYDSVLDKVRTRWLSING